MDHETDGERGASRMRRTVTISNTTLCRILHGILSQPDSSGFRIIQAFVNQISDLIFIKDAETAFLLVNKAVSERYGKTPAEMIGLTDYDLKIWSRETAEVYTQNSLRMLETGIPNNMDNVTGSVVDSNRRLVLKSRDPRKSMIIGYDRRFMLRNEFDGEPLAHLKKSTPLTFSGIGGTFDFRECNGIQKITNIHGFETLSLPESFTMDEFKGIFLVDKKKTIDEKLRFEISLASALEWAEVSNLFRVVVKDTEYSVKISIKRMETDPMMYSLSVEDIAQSSIAAKQIERLSSMIEALMEENPDFIYMTDALGRIELMNRSLRKALGIVDNLSVIENDILSSKPLRISEDIVELRGRGGESLGFFTKSVTPRIENGMGIGTVVTYKSANALYHALHKAKVISDATSEGIIATVGDDDICEISNLAVQTMLEMSESEIVGRPLLSLFAQEFRETLHLRIKKGYTSSHFINLVNDIEAVVKIAEGPEGVRIFRISDPRTIELDVLTGIYSRRKVEESLPENIERALRNRAKDPRTDKVMVVVMIDANDFKKINDTQGHIMGDEVIKSMAGILNCFYGIDFVARFGGDEFFICINDCTDADKIYRKINGISDKLFRVVVHFGDKIQHGISASFGMSVFDPKSLDPSLFTEELNPVNTRLFSEALKMVLIDAADQALIEAKRLSKSMRPKGGLYPNRIAHTIFDPVANVANIRRVFNDLKSSKIKRLLKRD